MKQVQYRRAAQSSGFRPAQVSGNDVARMREESARVVRGMRDARNAEIQERERQLAQEKEGQSLERRLRDQNRQIESANYQREFTGLQAEARAQQQQFQQTQQDNAKILQSISTISQSAGKAYAEYVEAEEDKTIAQELEDYLQNPIQEDLRTLQNDLGLDILDEMKQSQLDEYQARGGDPLVVAKSRNYSDRVRREILKGKATYFYQYKYPQLLQEAIRSEENRLGRKMDSSELAGYMTDVSRVVADKFRTEGGMSLKPGSMKGALELQTRHHQGILSGARAEEIKHENQQASDTATTILTQNPRDFEKNITPSFRTIYRVNGYDYSKAHDWYVSLATMRGPDGNFLFTTEQLASTVLQAGEKPYAEQRPGRFAAILQARLDADNQYRNSQITAENIAYKEASQNAREQFIANPTKETAESLGGYFIETYAKKPEWLTTAEQNYTVEAQAKAQQIEQLESIPDGFILKEHVEALSRLDSTAGRALEKRFAAQEAKYTSGVFKDQSDAFKTTANGVTSFGSQKPNDAPSLFLQQEMRAEYRKRVDQAVAGGADFNDAANTIAMQLTAEVKAGSRDENSLWYRKPSKAGGAADFPNLTGGNVTAVEKARRNYQGIVKSIAEKGLEKTLDTPESILTVEEIASIVEGYGKPGFVIPTDVLAVSGMGNGLDPFTIINRQIAALGDPNVLPLEPPAIIQSVNSTMTEQQRKDLFDAVNGPLQRLRSLQQVAGTVAQPSNLRAGFAGNSLKRSFTDALVYEGNKGAYQHVGTTLQNLGFQVAEHPDFGGVAPVHAGNSYHGYGEAFDITHQTGDYDTSIERTRQLKELIRSMNLFKEVIGPGDGNPAHETHLHLGGLMRPLTAEDIEKLNSFK
jgi:hypothetical protein|tara:strand:+ start:1041 stop:3644 length:2604 start_codon:yes stop_codon:yes gene_type:complete